MTRRAAVVLLGAIAVFCAVARADEPQYLVVLDPVQDIRQQPVRVPRAPGKDVPPVTQVFYNDALVYRGENQEWYSVEVPDQQRFAENGEWQGCTGWIRKKSVRLAAEKPRSNIVVRDRTARIVDKPEAGAGLIVEVPLGTKLQKSGLKNGFYLLDLPDGKQGWIARHAVRVISDRPRRLQSRKNIVKTARLLVSDPSRWGGISASSAAAVAAGFDPAGLVYMAYRANGIDIPRDCQGQWLKAEQLRVRSIKPGDIVFVAIGAAETMQHAMLYIGGEFVIEAPEAGTPVRVARFKDIFGVDMTTAVKTGYGVDGTRIYFGRIRQ